MSTKTKEIALIKEVKPLLTRAEDLEIKSPSDMTKATEMLSQLNKFLDKVIEEKEKITKPMNQALKEVRDRYKPTETSLSTAISLIRSSMSGYQTEQLKLKAIEEKKIADRIGDGKGKLKIETAVQQIENLSSPSKTIETNQGSIKFRTDKRLRITNTLLIPREYLEINESALLSALKLGKSIPGAEIELIQTPINSR